MRIGIVGSGSVGQHLGTGFVKSGHTVMIGTRDASKLQEWVKQTGTGASIGSFADAAAFGELLVIATRWQDGATENAITLAGKSNFAGKVVIDVTNPLVFAAEGQPPTLALGFPDSGGATIQRWLPDARIVKAFNIVTSVYMTNPKLQEGTPDLLIAGNDPEAKKLVSSIATQWGWNVIDEGGIEQAYLLEALAMIWIRYAFQHNSWQHAFKLLKK